VEDTAKRMAAKKMLKLLGVETYFPDPDKIPDITKAIEFFKRHLRNKKGKIIDAFDTMQRNDGRSGMSLFRIKNQIYNFQLRYYQLTPNLTHLEPYNIWSKQRPFRYFRMGKFQTVK